MSRGASRKIRSGLRPGFPAVLELLRRAALALFIIQFILVWSRLRVPPPGSPAFDWPEGLLLGLCATATLGWLSRQLPLQNVLLAAAGLGALIAACLTVGCLVGGPIGLRDYSPRMGWKLLRLVPWSAIVLWVAVLLNARGTARLLLRHWNQRPNYGYWVLGLTTVLVVWLTLGLEPFAGATRGYWSWDRPKSSWDWYGTPWVYFLGWAVMCGLAMGLVTPWLINKRPTPFPPAYEPLAIWLLLICLFLTSAIVRHQWAAAAVQFCHGCLVLVFFFRSGRPPAAGAH